MCEKATTASASTESIHKHQQTIAWLKSGGMDLPNKKRALVAKTADRRYAQNFFLPEHDVRGIPNRSTP